MAASLYSSNRLLAGEFTLLHILTPVYATDSHVTNLGISIELGTAWCAF